MGRDQLLRRLPGRAAQGHPRGAVARRLARPDPGLGRALRRSGVADGVAGRFRGQPLSAERLRVSEILDDAAEAAMRVAAPWMGLLWLCSLPLRLLQVHFVARLLELGPEASHYGNYLHGLALATMAALLPSLWARAVFVRA